MQQLAASTPTDEGESASIRVLLRVVSTRWTDFINGLNGHLNHILIDGNRYSMDELVALTRQLNLTPEPFAGFSLERSQYVIPDVVIDIDPKGRLTCRVNEEIPIVVVSEEYRAMLDDGNIDQTTHHFLKNHVDSADRFVNALNHRNCTLLQICEILIERQLEWFLGQTKHLKPLTRDEIADQLDKHATTIGRAVGTLKKGFKLIQTPQGTFPLAWFIKRRVNKAAGDTTTEKAMDRLRELVNSEDKRRPYSDPKLVRLLTTNTFTIAQRTVASYREKLGIPCYRKR